MKPCAVYYLLHPCSGEVRYVGVSVVPQRRLLERHLRDVGQSHKALWIQLLQRHGLQPVMKIIVWTTGTEARRLEVELIKRIPNLTNSTRGGDGLCDPTDDVRRRMSEGCLRAVTPEKREKMRQAKLGKPWSAKRREAHEQNPTTPGRRWSEERRAKHPKHRFQRPWSPERRARQMAAYAERRAAYEMSKNHASDCDK